jgi:hypothetical protein
MFVYCSVGTSLDLRQIQGKSKGFSKKELALASSGPSDLTDRTDGNSRRLRMATVRVQCGYPRVSVPRVSILVLFFRPWFCGFGYPKIQGFGAVFYFHRWCSVGARRMQPTKAQQQP